MDNLKISIIIPVYNGAETLGACLQNIAAHCRNQCEVIVVDDGSTDNTAELAEGFDCILVRLPTRRGAAAARNAGARTATGEILFFIDADCILRNHTIAHVRQAFGNSERNLIVGGTYTLRAWDDTFFSHFQSAFIHYSETKTGAQPDYIATHALAMRVSEFKESGGFKEDFLPLLEDVEFCHRLRQQGYACRLIKEIQVGHIFNFGLHKSWRNAFRKSRYWSCYSSVNGDLLADSGTASYNLKVNGICFILTAALCAYGLWAAEPEVILPIVCLLAVNLYTNMDMLKTFARAGGMFFGIAAGCYYLFVYPVPVLAGAVCGICLTWLEGIKRRCRLFTMGRVSS